MLRPLRASSMILRRTSGGYFGRVAILDSFAVGSKVSTEMGQRHIEVSVRGAAVPIRRLASGALSGNQNAWNVLSYGVNVKIVPR